MISRRTSKNINERPEERGRREKYLNIALAGSRGSGTRILERVIGNLLLWLMGIWSIGKRGLEWEKREKEVRRPSGREWFRFVSF